MLDHRCPVITLRVCGGGESVTLQHSSDVSEVERRTVCHGLGVRTFAFAGVDMVCRIWSAVNAASACDSQSKEVAGPDLW